MNRSYIRHMTRLPALICVSRFDTESGPPCGEALEDAC